MMMLLKVGWQEIMMTGQRSWQMIDSLFLIVFQDPFTPEGQVDRKEHRCEDRVWSWHGSGQRLQACSRVLRLSMFRSRMQSSLTGS